MARDHRSDDQENLFSKDGDMEEAGSGAPDLSSEDERLRNGDISFRPVSLPGSEPVPSVRRSGTGGTALMIVATIVVVLLLTWVIYNFYSPSPSAPQQAGLTEPAEGPEPLDDPTETISSDRNSGIPRDEPAAIFQAHAELQENFQKAEQRIAELESELEEERGKGLTTAAVPGSATDTDRLDRLEKENSQLKDELEQQRRTSQTAVSRAESQMVEERGHTRTAREEAAQARREAEALAREKSVLAGEVAELEDLVNELQVDLSRRKEEYDRLTANTTTRLEGESEAVRQLITRHADELERERKATREKEAEVRRLTELIARLSVTDSGTGTTEAARSTRSASTTAPPPAGDALTPPRILTRSDPVYPVNARRLKVEGTVLLNVLVGTDGRVRDVKVLEADGGKLLSPAAEDAVRKWTFSPATRGGQPVDCWHKVPIRFAL